LLLPDADRAFHRPQGGPPGPTLAGVARRTGHSHLMWAKFAGFFKFDGCNDDRRETAVPFHTDPATGGLLCPCVANRTDWRARADIPRGVLCLLFPDEAIDASLSSLQLFSGFTPPHCSTPRKRMLRPPTPS